MLISYYYRVKLKGPFLLYVFGLEHVDLMMKFAIYFSIKCYILLYTYHMCVCIHMAAIINYFEKNPGIYSPIKENKVISFLNLLLLT